MLDVGVGTTVEIDPTDEELEEETEAERLESAEFVADELDNMAL